MKIDSIKLCGWRSFDFGGIHIEDLKSINLIIGPNNSGKSNLAKYFNYLKSIATEDLLEGQLISVSTELDESQTWNWEKREIKCEVLLSKDNIDSTENKVSYEASKHKVTLNSLHDFNLKTSSLNTKVEGEAIFNDKNQIFRREPRGDKLSPGEWTDPSDNIAGYYDNKFYWDCFLKSLVFVDPIRHHKRNSSNDQPYYFDGAKIIEELDVLRNDTATPSNWANYKKQIKEWLSEILSEHITNVDIIDKDLCLEFQTGLSFSLDQLGTGVSQVMMLLSFLWIKKDKNLNVFLEEPEANLHPEALIKLVNIFEKELGNHKFFITTHSPSLIDCLNENWAVYRVVKSLTGASSITQNDNIIKHYETLDALGVKASQILQANTVLWVEGPSDRIYLKKWIEIFSDGKVKEGKDYSFLYFGGTNLASFTALNDTDQDQSLINILSTSRKVYLIADSDCSSQDRRDDEAYKAYLTSMLDRIKAANKKNIGLDSSLNDYVKVWISSGREIENYIEKGLFFDVLTGKGFKRETIGTRKDPKELVLKAGGCSGFTFEKFDSFDKAISNCYEYKDKSQLNDKDITNIALSYAKKKVDIAKSVVTKLNASNSLTDNLETKIKQLIDFIES